MAPPINVNRTLLARIPDAESKSLVANEARRPAFVHEHLYQGFDRLLADELGRTQVVTLKHMELLFAYNLELNTLRTRAVNEKYILLLLPGQRAGDRVTLFHKASPEWHKTLPKELLPETTFSSFMLRALKRFQARRAAGANTILDCSR